MEERDEARGRDDSIISGSLVVSDATRFGDWLCEPVCESV